jgi:hypothetical protein
MSPPAQMRAGQIKIDLASVGDFAQAPQIRAAVAPATIETIEKASTSAWLPLELDLELNKAVLKVMDEEGVRDWGRRAMVRGFEGPVLRPIVSASVAVFGLKPGTWLGWAPRLWPSIYRNCGEFTVSESAPNGCTLTYTHVPPVIARSRGYLLGLCGACEGAIQLCKTTGRVDCRQGATEGSFVYVARWK